MSTREQSLIERLAALSVQRTGILTTSSEAVVSGDTKAAAAARKAMSDIDIEIEQLGQAMTLAKQRDQEDEAAKRREAGLSAAKAALPLAQKRAVVAKRIDASVSSLVDDLAEFEALGHEMNGPASAMVRALGGHMAVFGVKLPPALFAKPFASTADAFDGDFLAFDVNDLIAARYPFASISEWAAGSVAELQTVLARHGVVTQAVTIPKVAA